MTYKSAEILTALFFFAAMGAIGGAGFANTSWRQDLIGRGLAMHCPLDGRFAFVGECQQ
jgi:hypothetical protein